LHTVTEDVVPAGDVRDAAGYGDRRHVGSSVHGRRDRRVVNGCLVDHRGINDGGVGNRGVARAALHRAALDRVAGFAARRGVHRRVHGGRRRVASARVTRDEGFHGRPPFELEKHAAIADEKVTTMARREIPRINAVLPVSRHRCR
jgi:hypothetical protein